jgi:hypothetical protein
MARNVHFISFILLLRQRFMFFGFRYQACQEVTANIFSSIFQNQRIHHKAVSEVLGSQKITIGFLLSFFFLCGGPKSKRV